MVRTSVTPKRSIPPRTDSVYADGQTLLGCWGCEQQLPEDDFPFNTSRADRRGVYCSTCWEEKHRIEGQPPRHPGYFDWGQVIPCSGCGIEVQWNTRERRYIGLISGTAHVCEASVPHQGAAVGMVRPPNIRVPSASPGRQALRTLEL